MIHILAASTSNTAHLPNRAALPVIRGTPPQILPSSASAPKPMKAGVLLCSSCLSPSVLISVKQKCPAISSRNSQDNTRSSQCHGFCPRACFPWQGALQEGGRRPPATSFPEDSTVTPNQALTSPRQRPHSQGKSFGI